MKIARWIFRILAVALLPIMLWLLNALDAYDLSAQKEYPHSFEYDQFTDEEQAEICALLQFAPAQSETLSLCCIVWPPDQIDHLVRVYVHGVVSEEDFLSRLRMQTEPHGDGRYDLIIKSENDGENGETISLSVSENAVYFQFNKSPLAEAILAGTDIAIPEELRLSSAEKFIYEHVNALQLAAWVGGPALELVFIIALFVMFRKAEKKEKP